MGYSAAVGRAKAKAKAKPTSCTQRWGHPQNDLHTKDQSQSPRCRSLSPRALPRRTPLNPPLDQKCAVCTDFVRQSSTAYTIKKACRDCGHSTVETREDIWEYPFQDCLHEEVNHRGSSKSTFRTLPLANSVDASSISMRSR